MITIKRNHFIKAKTFDKGINVSPLFRDLPQSTATTATLGTNASQNIYIMGTTIPDLPTYGDAEITGGYVSLYPSSVEQKDARNAPSFTSYRINRNIEIEEGGMSLSTYGTSITGDKVSVYNSLPNNEIPYLEEEFEGDPAQLESISRMGTNNVITKLEPYINANDLKRLVQEVEGKELDSYEWKFFIKSLETWDGQLITKKPFGALSFGLEYNQEFTGNQIKVEFQDANHTRWRIVRGYAPWLFQGLKYIMNHDFTDLSVVKYNKIRSAAGSLESTPSANIGNTIFDDFYASRNFSNPYDASESDPLIMTNIDLSSETSLNGGQSLRFYHNWGHSVYNFKLQEQLGSEKNVNAQCARASLYDIPFPSLPFDAARTTMDANSSVAVCGDTRGIVPEIRLPMNITKLAPNVLVASEEYMSADDPSTEIKPPLSSSSPMKFFYGSTATADANSNGLSISGPASLFEQTFLRSIVVTFSNYKPKPEHTTVDKFLAYGLRNFYRGKNYDNIVGGFVISRFGIDGDVSDASMTDAFAFPLPVSRCPQMSSAEGYDLSDDGDDYTLRNGGLAELQGSSTLSNLDILSWGRTYITDTTFVNDERIRFAQLPMNSWFTARIFTDIYQYNTSGSFTKRIYAPTSTSNPTYGADGTAADVQKRGSCMRVIFETGLANKVLTVSGTNTPILVEGETVNQNSRNLPFLDIPFPIGDASNSDAAIKTAFYSFAENPELYPKHMTIWVQNYPWVSGNVRATANEDTYNALFYTGDYDVTESGATREAELFIDSVKLLNYAPQVVNATAANSNGNINLKPKQIQSPLGTRHEEGTSNQYWINSWVNSGPINYTALCHVSGSGDSDKRIVKIANPDDFDVTFLENAVAVWPGVSVIKTGYLAGGTTITSLDSLDTFTISADPTGSAGTVSVNFQATGTTLPMVNKADLTAFNAGSNLVMGWNSINDFSSVDDVTNKSCSGYFLFNDFGTTDWTTVSSDPALPNKTEVQQGSVYGGIFSQSYTANAIDALGGQLVGTRYFTSGSSVSNISGAAYKIDGSDNTLASGMALGTGVNNNFISVDGFRQKGFVRIGFSGTTSSDFDKFVKRENILISARVVSCRDKSVKNNHILGGYQDDIATNQLKVSNTGIFNYFDEDEQYMVYLVGDEWSNKSMKTGLILDRTKLPVNNVVTFTNLTDMADDGATRLISESNLYRLMICPYKYTISALFNTPADMGARSYGSVCQVGQTPSISSLSTVSGTTLNEFTFSYTNATGSGVGGETGLYTNTWSLVPDPDNPTLITDVDYGYGEYDEEEKTGGYYFRQPAYVGKYNCYKLPNFTDPPQTNLNLALFYDSDATYDESITIATDDATTSVQRPTLYVEYQDLPPIISNFTVNPAINTLGQDFNYYDITDANLNAVTFNWDEENAGDVWYRMLFIDDRTIRDKYHRAVTYLPLNESVNDLNSASTSTVVYNKDTGDSVSVGGSLAVGSDTRMVPYGQAGWAFKTADTADGKLAFSPTAAVPGFINKSAYTLVIHWTPSSADKDAEAYIMTSGTYPCNTTGEFALYKGTDNKIRWYQGTTITGTTEVKCDGETPICITILYDANAVLGTRRRLLYVDTNLEAKSSTSDNVTTGPITLGGAHDTSIRGSTGTFEEVLIYDKAYVVLDKPNTYTYSTRGIEDISGSDPITHNALMIAADYHNFRGTSQAEIGMSTNATWRTTII